MKTVTQDDDEDDPQPSLLLSARYRQIADAASHRTPHWPASRSFVPLLDCRCCSGDDDHASVVASAVGVAVGDDGICTTKYRAPRFAEHGPFGLVALITQQYNPCAVPLIDECLDCFDAFVRDLRDAVPATTKQQQQELSLHIIPRAVVPHCCVFLVHGHPSLLQQQPERRDNAWRPIDDDTMQALVDDDLSPILASPPFSNLQLQLDSILLTPDGGMIAGFVDVSEQLSSAREGDGLAASSSSLFRNLKQQCIAAVQRRVGELTSRPKNLIHVTLGRVLGFGPSAQGFDSDDDNEQQQQQQQQQRVVQLVQRYNGHVLPQRVEEIKQRHNRGVWRLEHLSFLRNTVWFCEENIIYKTWDLTRNEPS